MKLMIASKVICCTHVDTIVMLTKNHDVQRTMQSPVYQILKRAAPMPGTLHHFQSDRAAKGWPESTFAAISSLATQMRRLVH